MRMSLHGRLAVTSWRSAGCCPSAAYLDPPENALVLSVDEKSHFHALERAQFGLEVIERYLLDVEGAVGWLESAAKDIS